MDWIDKYHPHDWSEVVGNQQTISFLKECVAKKDMPHLLFEGTAGTGKNTLAELLAKGMLGSNWKQNFTEMNASDKRTIDVVRERIIPIMKYPSISYWTKGGVPFKILFLDEADAIVPDAMRALKRPLELYKRNCRVIFSCNDISKIIPEIVSRCEEFHFPPLSERDVMERLKYIASMEGMGNHIDYRSICDRACGDMRKGILLLQKWKSNGQTEIDKILERYR
jgi:replication factor C small subunit